MPCEQKVPGSYLRVTALISNLALHALFQIPTVSKYTKVLQIRVDCTVMYTAAGFNSSFSFTNIPTATGHDLLQLLDPLLKLLCFPLDYVVVQTLDQDIGREEDDENGNVTAADMETSKKLLEEVSRKMEVCL